MTVFSSVYYPGSQVSASRNAREKRYVVVSSSEVVVHPLPHVIPLGKDVELNRKKAELDAMLASLEGMQKIETILDPLQSSMTLVRETLGVFASIWTSVSVCSHI